MTTLSDQELRTSDIETVHPERADAISSTESGKSALTQRYNLRGVLGVIQREIEPPSVLTERPASVAQLRSYAHAGGWTKSRSGALRALGVGYWRLVGLPTTVVCRYVEWIAQRPGRATTAFGLWWLIVNHGPGAWGRDHLLHPLGAALMWIFL